MYDAITQGVPLGTWPSIREQPLYQRFRYRYVHETMKSARVKAAVKAKAMGVIDLSNV